MRMTYLGTGEIGRPILDALGGLTEHRLVQVVTQPDRPAGRGQKLQAGAIKQWAVERGVAIFQPQDINTDAAIAELAGHQPDVLVVVAFGQYLKPGVRGVAPMGGVNFHPSLLPRHRGPSPYQSTILAGDPQAGVTIMRVDRGMDAGAIFAQRAVPLGPADTAGDLHDRLAILGAEMMVAVIADLAAGRAVETPQDPARATHTVKLTPEMGRVAWAKPAVEIDRLIRGLSPRPAARCRLSEPGGAVIDVRLLRSQLAAYLPHGASLLNQRLRGLPAPGEVVSVVDGHLVVACGDGQAVAISELQPPNGRVQSARDFVNGRGWLQPQGIPGPRLLDG